MLGALRAQGMYCKFHSDFIMKPIHPFRMLMAILSRVLNDGHSLKGRPSLASALIIFFISDAGGGPTLSRRPS